MCHSDNLPSLVKHLFQHEYFLFNWESLHARLNSHYEAWGYKKKQKKIKEYNKYV